jgi:filamentous hemagglutinin family protein
MNLIRFRYKVSTNRVLIFLFIYLFLFHTLALPVLANPSGAQVVAGNATFDHNQKNLNVHQSSHRAIINWQDFSISAGELTRFMQPSTRSAVLNRVISALPSTLAGTLKANGQVFLINPNGVIVGPTGRIETASFTASTLNIHDSRFMEGGDLHFLSDSDAVIINLGTIEATDGDILLIAHHVENSGILKASNGLVGLAAGNEVLLKEEGEELILVKTGLSFSEGEDGVSNTGLIESARAELKAAGGNIYALGVNNGGAIHAMGLVTEGGRVLLKSIGGNIENSGAITARDSNGDGGTITIKTEGDNGLDEYPSTIINSGTIDASGVIPGAKGGAVTMTGDQVALIEKTLVSANGYTGGGNVLIGGGFQGKDPDVYNAQQTFVGPDVRIEANALSDGDGGRVIVWADDDARFYGNISARGGKHSGDGGIAEVSGGYLDFQGAADMRAPSGEYGKLLLDPESITISNAVDSNVTGSSPFEPEAAGPAILNVDTLTGALALADVIVQAAYYGSPDPGNITVADAINWNASTKLTLNTANNIYINASITNPNGTLELKNFWDELSSTAGATIYVSNLNLLPGSGYASDEGPAITLNGPVLAGTVTLGTPVMYHFKEISIKNDNNQIDRLCFPSDDPPDPRAPEGIQGHVEIYDSAGGLTISGHAYRASSGSHMQVRTVGDLTLENGMVWHSDKDIFLEASNGNFINNGAQFGTDLSPRLRIYSQDPEKDTLGNVPPVNRDWDRVYGATLASHPPGDYDAEPKNLFFYSMNAPVLTFTIDDKTKVYGSANPALSWTFSGGLIAGDTEAVAYSGAPDLSTTVTANTGAGSYPITGAEGTLSMKLGYDYQFDDGALQVTKAPLSITADDKNKLAGKPNPPFTATYTGLVAGDSENAVTGLNLETAATQTSPAGNYTITPSDGIADNYEITYINGNLQILNNAAALTVTADDISRLYGDPNNFTLSYDGLQPGDDRSVVTGLVTSSTATNNSSVGTYPITLSGGTAPDYYDLVLVNGILTVNPAPLTIWADDKIKRISDPVQTLTATYTGLKAGDTENVVTGLTLNTDAQVMSPQGTYTITASGGVATNYTITHQNGQYIVKDPYPLTITADDKSRLYGEANPGLTVTYNGFQDGDDESVITGLNIGTTATLNSDVGPYPITLGSNISAPAYYDFVTQDGTLTIGPAPLIITAQDATRVYGASNPQFTATIEGLRAGDEASSVVTGLKVYAYERYSGSKVDNWSLVGNYSIKPTYSSSSSNYAITRKNGTLTITRKPVTITANDAYMRQGEPYPEFTYSLSPGLSVFERYYLKVNFYVSNSPPQPEPIQIDGNTIYIVPVTGISTWTIQGTTFYKYIIPAVSWNNSNYKVSVKHGTLSIFKPDPNYKPPDPYEIAIQTIKQGGEVKKWNGYPAVCKNFILMIAHQYFLQNDLYGKGMTREEWLSNPVNRGLLLPELMKYLKSGFGGEYGKQHKVLKLYIQQWMRDYQTKIAEQALQEYYQWRDKDRYNEQTRLEGLFGPSTAMPNFFETAAGKVGTVLGLTTATAAATAAGISASALAGAATGKVGATLFAFFGGAKATAAFASVATAATAATVIGVVVFAAVVAAVRIMEIVEVEKMEGELKQAIKDSKNFDINTILKPDGWQTEADDEALIGMLLMMTVTGAL